MHHGIFNLYLAIYDIEITLRGLLLYIGGEVEGKPFQHSWKSSSDSVCVFNHRSTVYHRLL